MNRALRLRAQWVVPVAADPIRDGAVLVNDRGRIALIGPDAAVATPDDADILDLGDAALLPGFVNTHTHLELTALRGLITDNVFPRWIQTIRAVKDGLAPEHFSAAARWGVLEHFAHGITTIGDTGSTGAAAWAMADLGARGVAYQEVFGPDPAQMEGSLTGLRTVLAALDAGAASERVRIGVSPHAPYTVSRQLLGAVASLARIQRRPIAMHLAESNEETQFIEEGRGPFADHLRGRGIEVVRHRVSPVTWALESGLGVARPLLIHCVQAAERDCQTIRYHGAAVAHCPWSNQMLGVGRANLGLLRGSGITVGLGTDSVAAGNGLDLFHESRLAAMGAALTPRERLSLFTRDAARALGFDDAGSITVGNWGDLCAISLAAPVYANAQSIEGAIASAALASDVTSTWVAGRCVYARGHWPGVDTATERAAVNRAERAARNASGRVGE